MYQPVRKLFCCLFFLLPIFLFAQFNDTTIGLLRKLDSVRNSSTVSRHFAGLYFNVTAGALDYFSKEDKPVQDFMQRLENRFADYFLLAAEAYNRGADLPVAWKNYYTDTSLTPVQYLLVGANAHINGDIWQALTSEFSLQELKQYKRVYYRYNKKLKAELLNIYDEAFNAVPKLRLLHFLSAGLDKQYSKLMLLRWRKRQMKLSMLWFTDRDRFQTKLTGIRKKMAKLDKLVLQNL